MWWFRKQTDSKDDEVQAIHKATFKKIDEATESIDRATESIEKLTGLLNQTLGTSEMIFLATPPGGKGTPKKGKKK